jgi:heavy metal sensor kinase
MKTRSIGFRLTLWYVTILLTSLVVFGVSVWISMHRSIQHAVDDELRERLSGVSRFFTGLLSSGAEEDIEREFEEHSSFTSHGELLQVVDSGGNFIYRSEGLRDLNISVPRPQRLASAHEFATVNVGATRFRTLSARVPVQGRLYSVGIARPMTEFDEVFEKLQWIALSLIPLVLILATAGGYWMSRRALAPFDEITRAARSIGIQNLAHRLAVPRTGDELQRLSETLNDMMQRLDTAVKRITQFTADASHELRTPIAVMRTTAEVALRRDRSATEYREALSQVLAELERTSGLVENLMLLARADSGAEALSKRPTDLAQSVREACTQGQTLAAARDILFEFALPEERIPVEGDAQALRRLFLILIDNAVKYTASRGSVSVSLTSTDGIAIGEVRDSGIGISRDDLPNIFERFYRADKARSREMGGAGLGLSIARWIVENHHGEIKVESEPGKGSIFRVELPLQY